MVVVMVVKKVPGWVLVVAEWVAVVVMALSPWLVAALLTITALLLSACSETVEPMSVEMRVTCPDPDERQRLGEGSTFRDLARSRAEAISGWQTCHDALTITQE